MVNISAGIQAATIAKKAEPKLRELRKATDGIESMFMKQLLSEMQKGISSNPFGGDTMGSDMYRDMFNNALADSLGKSNTLGIGQIMYKQMEPKVIQEIKARVLAQQGLDIQR